MFTSNQLMNKISQSKTFRTITGRRLDLTAITDVERPFVSAAIEKYLSSPKWNDFSSWWVTRFDESGLTKESVAYVLCEDLEARLGIAQGDFDLPEYRDYLEELIEERFGSKYRFCKEKAIDPAYLSRLLTGDSGLRVENLEKLLDALDAVLVVRRKEDLVADSDPREAAEALSSFFSDAK